jgi:hypothetical protein
MDDTPATPAAEGEYDYAGQLIEKQGWLIREVQVDGSQSTWKKQWNTLTLHELRSSKSKSHTGPNDTLSTISTASVEEMCYGTIDKLKSFAFELRTPSGEIKLAAESEQGMPTSKPVSQSTSEPVSQSTSEPVNQ